MPEIWHTLLDAFPADIRTVFPYADIVQALTFPRTVRNVLLEPEIVKTLPKIAFLLRQETISGNLKALLNSHIFKDYSERLKPMLEKCQHDPQKQMLLMAQNPNLQYYSFAIQMVLANSKLNLFPNPSEDQLSQAAQMFGIDPGALLAQACTQMTQQLQTVEELELTLRRQLEALEASGIKFNIVPDEELLPFESSKMIDLNLAYTQILESNRAAITFKAVFNLSREKRLLVADAFDALTKVVLSTDPFTQIRGNKILTEWSGIKTQTNSDAWALKVYEVMMEKLGIELVTSTQETAAE